MLRKGSVVVVVWELFRCCFMLFDLWIVLEYPCWHEACIPGQSQLLPRLMEALRDMSSDILKS